MRPALLPCTVLAAVMALSACGSTVQGSAALTPGAGFTDGGVPVTDGGLGTGPGTGPSVPGAPGGTSGGGGGFGTSGTGGTSGTSGGTTGFGTTPGGTGGGPGTTGTVPGGSQRFGPGVSATKIKVGVVYTKNGETGNEAIGGGGIARSDEKANADAVIAEVNAKGGVAGRKLEAVYATYDATSSLPADAQDQAACEKLTQDDKVLVVFSGGLTDVFPQCMQNAGVTVMSSGRLIDQDEAKLRQFPAVFQIGTLSQDRMMRELARSLARQQYYTGWSHATGTPSAATPVKVGIMTLDDPQWIRPLESVLLPALRAAGHPVADANVQRIPFATTTTDAGRQAQAVGSAVLRLRSDNVTHLVILDGSATVTLFFATAAKNQGYYPRIGANSTVGMQALTDAGVGGNDVFEGAVGLGWLPSIDVPTKKSLELQNPETKRCLEIVNRRTGQSLSTGNAASLALSACDTTFFFRAVANRAGGALDQVGLRIAGEGLGSSFVTAVYGATRLGPGRHDALEPGYDMAWSTECTCATYVRSFAIP